MNRPEAWTLFEKLDDGSISDKDFDFLQKRLKEDAELRKAYRAYMDMSSSLKDMADNEADVAWEQSQPETNKKKVVNFPAIVFAAIAACMAVVFFINYSANGNVDSDPEYVEEIESGYAQIKMTANVLWNGTEFVQGNYLQNETVKFDQGLVNLEFENGVDVVIEGPAEFKIVNDMKMLVKSGKLKANVPKSGHGFTIETDKINVVDLGTVFGVDVQDGKVDVQVIDGLVKLQENKQDIKEIAAGKAFSIDASKKVQELEYVPEKFKGVAELVAAKEELGGKAYKRWTEFVESRRGNLDVLAYYSFFRDRKWGRTLPNKIEGASEDTFGNGKYITRAPGRFTHPGSSFLFNQSGSKVDINLPGKTDRMTMLCWVNIESVDNHYNTLLESKNRIPGAPGWYIRKRMMFLNLYRPNGLTILRAEGSFTSPPFWKQSMRGVWVQLAVRITREKITFFRNGKKLSEVDNTVDYEYLEIGPAEIGNSSKQAVTRSLPLNFHGRMDEFIVIKRALSDYEIRQVYKEGNIE